MRKPDAFEKQHMGRVAELGCVLCQHLGYGPTPAQTHHIIEQRGLGQRSPHYLTIPLCPEHHTGGNGIHQLKSSGFYTRYKLDELDLLSMTIDLLMRGK